MKSVLKLTPCPALAIEIVAASSVPKPANFRLESEQINGY